MATQSLKSVENRIKKLTGRLTRLGHMRPGTLTVQYRNPAKKKNPFHQISYTHKGKSHSEYVRAENLKLVRQEIAVYTRFIAIQKQIIELSIEASRIRCGTHSASRRANTIQSPAQKCT